MLTSNLLCWRNKGAGDKRDFLIINQNQSLITKTYCSCLGCNLVGSKKLFYYSSLTFIISFQQTFTFLPRSAHRGFQKTSPSFTQQLCKKQREDGKNKVVIFNLLTVQDFLNFTCIAFDLNRDCNDKSEKTQKG